MHTGAGGARITAHFRRTRPGARAAHSGSPGRGRSSRPRRPIANGEAGLADELEVGLVNQAGGGERAATLAACEPAPSDDAQLLVHLGGRQPDHLALSLTPPNALVAPRGWQQVTATLVKFGG